MRKYLLLLIPLILLSCIQNKFALSEEVEAELIGYTNNYLGLKYEVAGVIVFHDVYFTGVAEITYFKNMKTIPLKVFIQCNDMDGSDRVLITLTYKDSQFGNAQEVRFNDLSMKPFMARDIDIPTFIWYQHNDILYEDGITPQELRAKLSEDGKDPPETTTVTEHQTPVKGDKSL